MDSIYMAAVEATETSRQATRRHTERALLAGAERTLEMVLLCAAISWWRGAVVRRAAVKMAGVGRMQATLLECQAGRARLARGFHLWAQASYTGF